MAIQYKALVNATAPAASTDAEEHFARKLTYETDCWDVHHDLSHSVADFVLVDVRSPDAYVKSHAVGAINIPTGKITKRRMEEYPKDTHFVVYCVGPGCNGADKAALRLAKMGRPVKIMIGGITTWEDIERFPVERG